MDEFSKKIDGIRNMLIDYKSKKYAIVNPELAALDEYAKRLYMEVLCSVLQYKNNPSEMQILYLKRLLKGIGTEDSAEEYMRRALEISENDIREFLIQIGNNNAKYYFSIDGIILMVTGSKNYEEYQYLAELIELLGVANDDLKCLCMIAKSILQQNTSYYDQSKSMINERLEELDFTSYIQNFYFGATVDSMKLIHYFAPDKTLSNDIEYKTQYIENKVIFENLNIDLMSDWDFNGCEEVIFKNCNVKGNTFSFRLNDCNNVTVKNCKFNDFSSYVFVESHIIQFTLSNCQFTNCENKYENGIGSLYYTWGELGGVFHTEDASNNATNFINNSSFRNCGGRNKNYRHFSAVISNCRCEVKGCSFLNCWNYNNNNTIDYEDERHTLFLKDTKGEDNEIKQSAKLC